ncbi:hypothetical protein [Clostridium guangxiense]|uniref:hypothetical protein n=1 Tax=Clostridium guangxiense TaxID=1662055 RepID=UPI001E532B04|nr:hypothetical protein [Clostridium guangxiense]MCD2347743.1 hypothetical protein [Clostridium guangxiense]
MIICLEIVGLITMLIFCFIGIWSFILLNQLLGQFRYKNYLMEKLIQSISYNSKKNNDPGEIINGDNTYDSTEPVKNSNVSKIFAKDENNLNA